MEQARPDSTLLPAAQIGVVNGSHGSERVVAIGPILRAKIEAAIEAALDTAHRLIALLDAEDGDPCLEMEEADATAVEWSGRGAQRFNLGEAA
ncbi:hypothetical protein R1A27_20305 [Methylobacterium sp. NMS12]|uniref:hypothetical protein n=1 Tax=Methylobacterium sp. NMS12 TaxID=3079766 RepID=UPI003F883755